VLHHKLGSKMTESNKRTTITLSENEKEERVNALVKWWEEYTGENKVAPTIQQLEEQKRIESEAAKRKNMNVEDLAVQLINAAVKVPKIKEEYQERLRALKQQYVNDTLNEKILEVQSEEAAAIQELIEGLEDEVRFCAQVLKERVEVAYTAPVTSEMMIQLDALSKVELSEDEFRLYLERYQGVPLVMKRLAKIANDQGLKTTVLVFNDYMKRVIFIVREMHNIISNIKQQNVVGLMVAKNTILEKCIKFNEFMNSLLRPEESNTKVGNLRKDYLKNSMKAEEGFDDRLDKLINKVKNWDA